MTDLDWLTWTRHHAALFQLTSDADTNMLAAWRPLLDEYGAVELFAASNHIAANVAAFRTEHLRLIRQQIARQRTEKQRQYAEAQGETQGGCEDCGVSGWACVPHPVCVVNGEWQWPYRTTAIYCACPIGTNMRDRHERHEQARENDHRLFRLVMCWKMVEYELRFPGWRVWLRKRAEDVQTESRARALAAHADKVLPLASAVGEAYGKLVRVESAK